MENRSFDGFPLYLIDENGNITNKETGKTLKPFYTKSSNGPVILLQGYKKRRMVTISRVVYQTFIGPVSPNEIVIFKDGNEHNTHWSNLGKRSRKNPFVLGHKLGRRVPDEVVRYIRESEDTLVALSKELKIPVTTVGMIKRLQSYKSVI